MKMTQDPDSGLVHQVAAMAANSIGLELGDYREGVIACATHKFCEHFHGGQGTNLYANMCSIGIRGDNELDEEAEEIYNALVLHFTGCDIEAMIAWNNRMRAVYAMKAVKAYAEAKGEPCEECDIDDLVTDLLHLKSLAYAPDKETVSEDAAQELAQSAFGRFTEEANETPSTSEESSDLPYGTPGGLTAEGTQDELLEFLTDIDCDENFKKVYPPKWRA